MNNNLKIFRKNKNLSQQQMAEVLEVTLSFYGKIECGVRNPSFNFMKKLKLHFSDVNIDKIFFNN